MSRFDRIAPAALIRLALPDAEIDGADVSWRASLGYIKAILIPVPPKGPGLLVGELPLLRRRPKGAMAAFFGFLSTKLYQWANMGAAKS